MMSVKTDSLMAKLILSIAREEKGLEVVRQVLAEQPLFEPYSAFQRIDRKYHGYITSNDIAHFLKECKMEAPGKTAFFVLKYYDSDQDGKLTYKEFLPMVLPLNNSKLRADVATRSIYEVKPSEQLPYNVEYALARVVQKEVEAYRTLERLKEELAARYDFNVLDAFKIIDIHHTRSIDFENLYAYLAKREGGVHEEDIIAFIRRLDKDFDCKVSYMEFMDGILPVETKRTSRPSYTTHTKSSLSKSEKKVTASITATPAKERISRTASKRPASSQKKRSDNVSFYTPMKKESIVRPKSQERVSHHSSSSIKKIQNAYQISKQDKTETPSKSPLRSILKKPGASPIVKFTPTKAAQFQISQDKGPAIFYLFKEQLKLEKSLEVVREDLSLKKDVALLLLYSAFDPNNKDSLGITDFIEGLRSFELNPTIDEAYLMFNRFDRDMDGLLKYGDICDIFLPRQPEYASIFANRKLPEATAQSLSKDSFELIKRLLKEYIEVELSMRTFKLNMRDFSPRRAFDDCDIRKVGYFTKEDMEEIFSQEHIIATYGEIDLLLDKFDKNRDGRVSFSEFLREIQITG